MTPCEERGYKVGDKFQALPNSLFPVDTIVTLEKDDGDECPLFAGPDSGWYCAAGSTPGAFDYIDCFVKIS